MTRRMSCSMTVPAVRARTKTVTRRHVDTWKNLKVGDRLTLIEKGMGLPKGAHQVVLAEVEIIDVRVEVLALVVLDGELGREGLPHLSGAEFVDMWVRGHGYASVTDGLARLSLPCRRIEWRFLDDQEGTTPGDMVALLDEADVGPVDPAGGGP